MFGIGKLRSNLIFILRMQAELETLCSDPNKYNPKGISLTDEEVKNRESENIYDKNQSNFNLKVYPNPIKSFATLEFFLEKEENISIVVSNLLGQQVKSFYSEYTIASGNQKLELNMSDLPVGNYIVELKTSSKKEIKRLIKH